VLEGKGIAQVLTRSVVKVVNLASRSSAARLFSELTTAADWLAAEIGSSETFSSVLLHRVVRSLQRQV
jgi:hypothetical protein